MLLFISPYSDLLLLLLLLLQRLEASDFFHQGSNDPCERMYETHKSPTVKGEETPVPMQVLSLGALFTCLSVCLLISANKLQHCLHPCGTQHYDCASPASCCS
ncbi:hypothetical protein BJ546DRAFT_990047 [Cryomyces antarcticus]